jgi:hypothetical protein
MDAYLKKLNGNKTELVWVSSYRDNQYLVSVPKIPVCIVANALESYINDGWVGASAGEEASLQYWLKKGGK